MPHLTAAEVGSSEQMAELWSPLWGGPQSGEREGHKLRAKVPRFSVFERRSHLIIWILSSPLSLRLLVF